MKRSRRVTVIIIVFILLAGFIFFLRKDPPQVNGSAGRFISYDNGTVLDSETNLMWADNDSGGSTTWTEAKKFCESYRGGGYADWRMPTVKELESLYDKNEPGYRPECAIYNWKIYLTNKIHLTGAAAWASLDYGKEAECFMFDYGCRSRMFKSVNFIMRALPVRNFQN